MLVIALLRVLYNWHMFVPLAPAAQDLRVGLRQRFRGKPCGGMLGAIVHVVLLRAVVP